MLGTAAYMSPEQAKGRAADKRSDVWAFGCVLFEMVTGRRAFQGEDISDTLAAVLRGEPEWTALPANVSPALVALLRGCLDKDRRRRVADLSIARYILDREGEAVAAVAVSPASHDPARRFDPGGGRGGGRDRRVHDLLAHQGVGALVAGRAVHHRAPDG